MFLSIGIGLIVGKVWGYHLTLAGSALYGIDRLLFVLDKDTRDAYLASSGVTEQVSALIDTSMFDQLLIVATLATVACWCGFAFYIYTARLFPSIQPWSC